ncbi:MAG TPA: ABC transporter permease, partial [Candidatus Bathyarchaeota archaeon]|nr:ABC transporter permease [Candidatus Bathyarchaeota archaeon]
MLKGWKVIAKKELKQLLRDPKITIGMIIIPLIMYPLMGSLFRASIETSMRQEIKIALVDEDRGEFSTYLKQYLNTLPNVKLAEYDCSLSEAIKRAWAEEVEALIYIPPGASESLE